MGGKKEKAREFCQQLAGWARAGAEARRARESRTGPVTCLRREEAGVGGAAADVDFDAIKNHSPTDRCRRWRVERSAPLTTPGAIWPAARAKSDQVRAVRLLQMGRK
jgi:hypothetical protein